MTKIKICGITRVEDALRCAELGADFIGLVFVPESPRCVTEEQAREIRLCVGPAAPGRPIVAQHERISDTTAEGGRRYTRPAFVGVFRDVDPLEINRIASFVGLDYVQLHGSESDDHIGMISLPTIKAVSPAARPQTCADYLLFDSAGGGSGHPFDWSLLDSYDRRKPFFLAGGLDVDNVGKAIETLHPHAVDVSSGVESSPGIKDHRKLQTFIGKVRA